jgi:hypothetical protein
MQRKLTDTEIAMAKTAQESLGNGFFWESTPDGRDYWHGVSGRLLRMVKHGTSDGKPWVEPEVVIDDKWAAVWPRRWVMVRDNENVGWCGPQRLIGVSAVSHPYSFIVEDTTAWMYCRPATPKEITEGDKP